MIKTALFGNNVAAIDNVYGGGRKERIAQIADLYPVVISDENFDSHAHALTALDAIFSSWGMPVLNREQLAQLPQLKAVFCAAGSVKGFATPLLERNVMVVSGWGANAIPVAEFTVAQILLANKGYFRNICDYASAEGRSTAFRGTGNYDTTIALLGVGMVGRKVIELLRPFCLQVLVFDPFLTQEDAVALGVAKMSLDDAFRRGMVVSNHVANVPETMGMLRADHFNAMPENAVFINTGRGATVVEDDLVGVLKQRPDIVALLDVTNPEPPSADSPFYKLPNAILSSHIAGSIGGEVTRMADTMIEEFLAWSSGKPLRYAVTAGMLRTMA